MRKFIYKYLLIIASVTMFSCSDEIRGSLDLTSDVDIHSFTINGVEGNIVNDTITLTLPYGTDLTSLTPEITIGDSAKISPAIGEALDFSESATSGNEVVYTVTNGDLYQKYYVVVDVASAKITSFKIGSASGTIDQTNKTITVYIPDTTTDVTSLTPVVDYTDGATLSPESGTTINFSNPVDYTLSYLGSTFVYTVTVILGDAPKPVVTIYNGEDISPTWASIASTIYNSTANPATDGINTSSKCVAIMRNNTASDDGGRAWSGGALWNSYQVDIDPAEYSKLTLMVLKSVAGTVQLEIQSAGETEKDWLKADYSADHLGEWQELTFDIPTNRTAVINNILVAPHCTDDTNFTSQMMYWDNLKVYPK